METILDTIVSMICKIITVKEHQRTSSKGLVYTVKAHLRNICHAIEESNAARYSRDKTIEVKPRPKPNNSLNNPKSLKWSVFYKKIESEYPFQEAYKKYINASTFEVYPPRKWNWFGPGWWGGSEDSANPGNLAPVNVLDKVAMRHDFGYRIAELLSKNKKGEVDETLKKRIESIVDIIAVRDALNLDESDFSSDKKEKDLIKEMHGLLITGFTMKVLWENTSTQYIKFDSTNEKPIMDAFQVDVPLELMNNIKYITSDNQKFEANDKGNISLNIELIEKLIDKQVFEWWLNYKKKEKSKN